MPTPPGGVVGADGGALRLPTKYQPQPARGSTHRWRFQRLAVRIEVGHRHLFLIILREMCMDERKAEVYTYVLGLIFRGGCRGRLEI